MILKIVDYDDFVSDFTFLRIRIIPFPMTKNAVDSFKYASALVSGLSNTNWQSQRLDRVGFEPKVECSATALCQMNSWVGAHSNQFHNFLAEFQLTKGMAI